MIEETRRESHLLTNKEIQAKRNQKTMASVRKTTKVVGKIGKEVGKVGIGLGRAAWQGLEYLGKEGQKSKTGGRIDMGIDLGLNKDQQNHKTALDSIFRKKPKAKRSTLTPKQRRKVRIMREERRRY